MQRGVSKDASLSQQHSAHPERLKVWLGEHEKSTTTEISYPGAALARGRPALPLRPPRSRATRRARLKGPARRTSSIADQAAGYPDSRESAEPFRQPDHLEIFRELRIFARHRKG